MDRRSLLKLGAACLLPITLSAKAIASTFKDGPYYSPFIKEFGEATNIQITSEFNMEQIFDIGKLEKYELIELICPVEVTVTITYKHGIEVWKAFNLKNQWIKNFSMKEFFNSKFVPGEHDYGGHFEYGGTKFLLSAISVNDDAPKNLEI